MAKINDHYYYSLKELAVHLNIPLSTWRFRPYEEDGTVEIEVRPIRASKGAKRKS